MSLCDGQPAYDISIVIHCRLTVYVSTHRLSHLVLSPGGHVYALYVLSLVWYISSQNDFSFPHAGLSAFFMKCEHPQNLHSLSMMGFSLLLLSFLLCVTTQCTVSGLSYRPYAIAFSAVLQIVTHVSRVRFSSFSSQICIVASLIPMTIRSRSIELMHASQ